MVDLCEFNFLEVPHIPDVSRGNEKAIRRYIGRRGKIGGDSLKNDLEQLEMEHGLLVFLLCAATVGGWLVGNLFPHSHVFAAAITSACGVYYIQDALREARKKMTSSRFLYWEAGLGLLLLVIGGIGVAVVVR
jgi:hypothetical protein